MASLTLYLTQSAPIPSGRSVISCKKMIDRLKGTYKTEMAQIKTGEPVSGGGDDAGGKPATSRKRKAKNEKVEGEEQSPKKGRGRKKRVAEPDADIPKPKVEGSVKEEAEAEEV